MKIRTNLKAGVTINCFPLHDNLHMCGNTGHEFHAPEQCEIWLEENVDPSLIGGCVEHYEDGHPHFHALFGQYCG